MSSESISYVRLPSTKLASACQAGLDRIQEIRQEQINKAIKRKLSIPEPLWYQFWKEDPAKTRDEAMSRITRVGSGSSSFWSEVDDIIHAHEKQEKILEELLAACRLSQDGVEVSVKDISNFESFYPDNTYRT